MKLLTTPKLGIWQKTLNDTLNPILDPYGESLHFEIESTFENLRTIFLTKYLELIRNERSLKARSLTVALVTQFKKTYKFNLFLLFHFTYPKYYMIFHEIFVKSHQFVIKNLDNLAKDL